VGERGVGLPGVEQASAFGDGGGLHAGGGVEFAEDVGDVDTGGARADEQRGGDLRVGLALAEQLQHVQLPVGQPERSGGRWLIVGDRVGRGAQVDPGAAGEVLDRGHQRNMLHRQTGRRGQHRRRGSRAAMRCSEQRLGLPPTGVAGAVPIVQRLPPLGRDAPCLGVAFPCGAAALSLPGGQAAGMAATPGAG
jgi:hypothetical protein